MIKQREKLKIDSLKNEILDNLPYNLTVKVPYQSTGAASTIVGSTALGGFGAWLSSSEEGRFKWKDTNLMVLKTGISLSDFSTTILYEDVIEIVIGSPNIIVSNKGSISFGTGRITAKALELIIKDKGGLLE